MVLHRSYRLCERPPLRHMRWITVVGGLSSMDRLKGNVSGKVRHQPSSRITPIYIGSSSFIKCFSLFWVCSQIVSVIIGAVSVNVSCSHHMYNVLDQIRGPRDVGVLKLRDTVITPVYGLRCSKDSSPFAHRAGKAGQLTCPSSCLTRMDTSLCRTGKDSRGYMLAVSIAAPGSACCRFLYFPAAHPAHAMA